MTFFPRDFHLFEEEEDYLRKSKIHLVISMLLFSILHTYCYLENAIITQIGTRKKLPVQ